jgi:hypothetical protein
MTVISPDWFFFMVSASSRTSGEGFSASTPSTM